MSLIMCTYVREGIVLASDSRSSISNKGLKIINTIMSDTVNKTFLTKCNRGISTCGNSSINGVPIALLIKDFMSEVIEGNDFTVEEIADKLLAYFISMSSNLDTIFIVAGYDTVKKEIKLDSNKGDTDASEEGINDEVNKQFISVREQRVFRLFTKQNIKQNILQTPTQGAIWNGEISVLSKVLNTVQIPQLNKAPIIFGFNGIAYNFFTLQDAIDFSRFGIRTTIEAMKFETRYKTVGGPIDILVIKPDKAFWVIRKELK